MAAAYLRAAIDSGGTDRERLEVMLAEVTRHPDDEPVDSPGAR